MEYYNTARNVFLKMEMVVSRIKTNWLWSTVCNLCMYLLGILLFSLISVLIFCWRLFRCLAPQSVPPGYFICSDSPYKPAVAAELVKPFWHDNNFMHTEDFARRDGPFLALLKATSFYSQSSFILEFLLMLIKMSVLPVMSHRYRLQSSSNSSRKLSFNLWRAKLDLYRISHRQASSWVQQGKEWVRWLMRRKEDLRGLAVTWKQPCGNRLYASQCQTWSCWHTSWCWARSIS